MRKREERKKGKWEIKEREKKIKIKKKGDEGRAEMESGKEIICSMSAADLID